MEKVHHIARYVVRTKEAEQTASGYVIKVDKPFIPIGEVVKVGGSYGSDGLPSVDYIKALAAVDAGSRVAGIASHNVDFSTLKINPTTITHTLYLETNRPIQQGDVLVYLTDNND